MFSNLQAFLSSALTRDGTTSLQHFFDPSRAPFAAVYRSFSSMWGSSSGKRSGQVSNVYAISFRVNTSWVAGRKVATNNIFHSHPSIHPSRSSRRRLLLNKL